MFWLFFSTISIPRKLGNITECLDFPKKTFTADKSGKNLQQKRSQRSRLFVILAFSFVSNTTSRMLWKTIFKVILQRSGYFYMIWQYASLVEVLASPTKVLRDILEEVGRRIQMPKINFEPQTHLSSASPRVQTPLWRQNNTYTQRQQTKILRYKNEKKCFRLN